MQKIPWKTGNAALPEIIPETTNPPFWKIYIVKKILKKYESNGTADLIVYCGGRTQYTRRLSTQRKVFAFYKWQCDIRIKSYAKNQQRILVFLFYISFKIMSYRIYFHHIGFIYIYFIFILILINLYCLA